jgi:hypothetical protein
MECSLFKINNPKLTDLANTFVHRQSWFNMCDFAYTAKDDPWSCDLRNAMPYNVEDVPENSVIFATPYGIEKFLEQEHPKIKNPYIMITNCYGPVFKYTDTINDPKIKAWFGNANSNAITFDKFTLIPLGLFATEEVFNRRAQFTQTFEQFRARQKDKLLYMNFFVHKGQHVEVAGREALFNKFKNETYCHTVVLNPTWRKPFLEYMDDMSYCKFTLSPQGDMDDCYRHWEAIMVGSIPIMHRCALDKIFDDLPVIIVDDYEEINENFLNAKYEEIHNKSYNINKLYMQYWSDLINQAKAK